METNEIFKEAVKALASIYPYRNIRLYDTPYGQIVNIDGEDKFNISGYCLLYNLQRLCKALEDELL